MSYGDIVGRLIKVLANEGTSKLEHIIKSSQQSQTASGVWDFVLNFFRTKQAGNMTGSRIGSLGVIAGALLNGGAAAVKGAMGGGVLAMLGTLAINALQKRLNIQSADIESGLLSKFLSNEDIASMSSAETEKLVLSAMINAAKADGQLDQQEMDKILGKAGVDGISDDEKRFIQDELSKPFDLQNLVSAVPNQVVGAQVYAASLFAIDINTDAEKDYLKNLAQALELDGETIARLHEMTGAPLV